MRSRYEVTLNGIALSTLCPKLLILDYEHTTTNISRKWSHLANRDMMFREEETRSGCGVTVKFEIHLYNIAERQRVCQQIVSWAKDGGWLETNDRPGQKLHCVCDELPAITSALHWTDELSVTFMAYDQPFWIENSKSVLTLTGTSAEGYLSVPGNAGGALVEVIATPGASTVTSLALTVGNTTITLSGISATSSTPIAITYLNGIQSIKQGTTSILDKRTSGSADDLIAVCGEINHISITADNSVTAVFSVSGVWL